MKINVGGIQRQAGNSLSQAAEDNGNEKTGARRPRSSWLVARIKLEITNATDSRHQASSQVFTPDSLRCFLPVLRCWLCAPARSYRQIAHLRQDARHLHPVQ